MSGRIASALALFLAFVVALVAAPSAFALPPALPDPGFSIEYRSGYKVLTVKAPWPGSPRSYRYILYPRGGTKPAGEKADRFIPTPVRSVVTFSTSYLPAIEAIGETASIVGVDDPAFIYSPALRERVAAGKVVATTKNWAPDVEKLIALKPDLVLAYGMGNEWDIHPKLDEAGLPLVIVGEWNEADPLARAQWAVFIAAFYGKEDSARAAFATLADSYEAIRLKVKGVAPRPTVLVNGPFQGVWSVSGGRSYMARMIADAGGRYLWEDDKSTGALNLSVEAVFARAAGADFWLNPSLAAARLSDVRGMDPRFAALAPVTKTRVWNNTLRMSPGGGSDYFESAALRPDLVLADMAAIFHPELFPAHRFTYYRKLPE